MTPDDELDPTFDAALSAYSETESRRRFEPPAGFADAVLARLHADIEVRRRTRRTIAAVVASLAAAVVVTVSAVVSQSSRPNDVAKLPLAIQQPQSVIEPTTPRVSDALADAGQAVSTFSQRTADRAVKPTRSFIDAAERVSLASPAAPEMRASTDSLAGVPAAAKSSVEPLTGTTRKALQLLLRDTGLTAKTKS